MIRYTTCSYHFLVWILHSFLSNKNKDNLTCSWRLLFRLLLLFLPPPAIQSKVNSHQRLGNHWLSNLIPKPKFESLVNAYRADLHLYEKATQLSGDPNLLMQMRLLQSALSSLGRLISVVEKNRFDSELWAALSQQGLTLESLQNTRLELLSQNHAKTENFRVSGIRYQVGQFLGLRYAWDELFSKLEAENSLGRQNKGVKKS